ncbi:unnamed protein product, partial [Closterium sp. NIES-54]
VKPVTFLLRLPTTWKLHNAFHVQLLKPYKDPNQQFTGRQLPPPPPVLVRDEPKYEVERVLAHRRRRGKMLEFLIRWKGYDQSKDSWAAEADMGNARRALKDYLVKQVRLQLRERFVTDLPVLCLHSDRGAEFSSDLLRDFCRGEGILQSFTLPDSPQKNGIAERRIG